MQNELSVTEQSFLYQMSDMLTIQEAKPTDSGGESLQMQFLTEEEANAADAMEWNSKLAYGAREEDLVTFLEASLPSTEHESTYSLAYIKCFVAKHLCLVTPLGSDHTCQVGVQKSRFLEDYW